MRAWIAVLLIATALAGCTEPDATDLDSQDVEPTPEPEPQPEPEPEPELEPEPNTAPTAALTANATTGDAPMQVTFTLDGADADGDNLTWTFDRDDDGSIEEQGEGLPASLTYTYEVGNHTARLVVYDGAAEANATVLIESFEPAGPEAPAGPAQSFSLAWPVGGTDLPTLLNEAAACEPGPGEGTLYASFEVEPDSQGRSVSASVTHGAASESALEWGVVYFNDDCTLSDFVASTGGALAGTVPGFATWAILYSDGGAEVEVTYSAG